MKILLLEDEFMLARSIRTYLLSRGHLVDHYDNGQEVLDVIESKMHDFYILDINTPLVGGLECLKAIAQRYPDVPKIVISAYHDIDYISDAFDLAVILQMLLNYGEYGGKQYLMPSTVREFTRAQYPETGNRRGLGFDKPPAEPIADGPACRSASPVSFGHSGFTGTYAWADPSNGLIYIFLSNRVCPDAGNNRLAQMNIRTDLHQAVYDMLEQVQDK